MSEKQRTLVGDVGTAKSSARDAKSLLDDVGEDADLVVAHVDTLDHGDGVGIGRDVALERLADIKNELSCELLHAATTYLVRQHEDEKSRVARGLLDVRDGNNVLGELHVGEVLLVGVLLVDDVRQVLTVDLEVSIPLKARSTYLFLVDIHVHLALERVRVARGVVACRSASRIPTGYACTYPQSWQWRYPCAVLAACSLALDVPVARADNGDLLLLDSHDVGRGAMDS